MHQDQLDGIMTFVAVAEEKGFSAAAVRLGVSPSAVSQAIRTLEKRVGLALFSRNTRGVSLTEAGEKFFERVLPAVRELALASEELGAAAERPSGTLRITVARSGHMIVLQPVLRRFLERYPEIRVDLCIDNSLVDIVARGFDAGIRFGDRVERDMVAVRIGPPIEAHIVASPDYLERRGVPKHPHDLAAHDCISSRLISTGQIERWSFRKNGESLDLVVTGRLILNDSAALVQSALDGIGIAYMINGYIERFIEEGRLVRLLADWSPPLPGYTLYYPDRRHVAPKLRAFIDFLRDERDGLATSQQDIEHRPSVDMLIRQAL
ncbi:MULTISPECIES: LysR family transcriptional regulator [unclassified Caballeronia]|uniref:LysR family transcriptional regulator n=1 Tax=unclassified Caballeronia TaxID=2646786 RepID=UPI00285D7DA6|nr:MULTISPECIES: LysR family transcriptional regulator [unclassified Caballeronia]MDR5774118.1 LysR family transcriptional regulator [Caballeronia sp. LZ002]MDR5849553.1 LysR family transcriptional regulator [Caballeronia sp. LZ003]